MLFARNKMNKLFQQALDDLPEAARLARAFREPDRNAACCRALALEAWHLRGQREEAVDWAERALSLEGQDELSLQLISQLLTCSSRRFRQRPHLFSPRPGPVDI